ncbi:VOC family protein [Skermania piniformis]|uniref:VOC family protein n=1 Tax=Skermania pinensis TaxID=39122 RepID=A0ABX8S7R5_9ACTN|nr:VOC family protein [Skermania piniformis]QXQ13868.1 VOC family protein [Skermania piniformis]
MSSAPAVGSPNVRPQPLLCVGDVRRSGDWYRAIFGLVSGHPEPEHPHRKEYERLLSDGRLVLQLHVADAEHHHGGLVDPDRPLGNGLAVWFEVADFDGVVERVRARGARVQTEPHRNPNSSAREIWLRDPDGYLVVAASEPELESGSTGW